MVDVQEERRLEERLCKLHLEAKKKSRALFLILCGALGSFVIVVACISTRSREFSAMELYGILPVTLLVLLGAATVIAGWRVGKVEDRIRATKMEIRSLYEYE